MHLHTTQSLNSYMCICRLYYIIILTCKITITRNETKNTNLWSNNTGVMLSFLNKHAISAVCLSSLNPPNLPFTTFLYGPATSRNMSHSNFKQHKTHRPHKFIQFCIFLRQFVHCTITKNKSNTRNYHMTPLL